MQEVFQSINGIFSFIGPLSDFLWDFPTNFEWYANIPVLGNFSFAIILLITAVLKNAMKSPWVQAVMSGLKPCIIGIILATGVEMILNNLILIADFMPEHAFDPKAIGLTAALAVILFGSKYVLKKKLSPIALICIAAVLGMVVYGV